MEYSLGWMIDRMVARWLVKISNPGQPNTAGRGTTGTYAGDPPGGGYWELDMGCTRKSDGSEPLEWRADYYLADEWLVAIRTEVRPGLRKLAWLWNRGQALACAVALRVLDLEPEKLAAMARIGADRRADS